MGQSVGQSVFSQSMPPPLSRQGSGRPLTQLSETSVDVTPAGVVPSNAPATAEMVRNHTAVTAAEVKMALAKAEYIQAYADLERFRLYERFVALKFSARKQARQTAHEALDLPSCTDAMRLRAEETFMQQMDPSLPRAQQNPSGAQSTPECSGAKEHMETPPLILSTRCGLWSPQEL